jgi:hypothetical protein
LRLTNSEATHSIHFNSQLAFFFSRPTFEFPAVAAKAGTQPR